MHSYNVISFESSSERKRLVTTDFGRSAQKQFGRQASFYAQSSAHQSSEGLDVVTEYLSHDRYRLTVDVGTGAGFTAFASAPFSDHVLATDIAPEMLRQAGRLADERNISNVGYLTAEAESLPFVQNSVDAVTSRQAAHHFHNLGMAITEVWRVLKPNGVFIFTDPVAPEGESEAEWMNDVEVRRDATHIRDLNEYQWRELLHKSGFEITHFSITKVHLEFNYWVRRAATPREHIITLRKDFLSANPSVVQAFGIQVKETEIWFHWDVLVVRAVKTLVSR